MGRAIFKSAILAALMFVPFVARAADEDSKYNVLLIVSDDLRAELGCYGSQLAKTPNLDDLAASGVRFERAYCQYPLCNPSRTSMLTGRYPLTTGVVGNRTWFAHERPDYVSLPKYFRQNGYVTLRAGKIFHGGLDDTDAWTEGGEERTFDVRETASRKSDRAERRAQSNAERSDRWVVLPGEGERHGDYRTADRTIALLEKHRDEPFFLACGFSEPHSPLEAPQRFYDLYDVAKIPLPSDFAPRPTVPPGFPTDAIRAKNADLFVGRDATPKLAKEMIRAYLASTSYVDWNVGRVLTELDKLGLREKTIVVFWGDHGYQLGEKGKWSKAGSLYEQGTRVPLIIDDPRATGNGKACERIVESIDIYPTLVELCGLAAPPGLDGRSLATLVANPEAAWDHPAYTIWIEGGRNPTGYSVRTAKWRYTEYDGPRGGAVLFDETADPNEMQNLADDPKYTEVRQELAALIRIFRARFEVAKPADETSRGPA